VRLPRGIARLFRLGAFRPEVRRDLDEELRFHLDEVVDELRSDGLSEQEARSAAERRFGDLRRYRRTLERMDRARERLERRAELLDAGTRAFGSAIHRVIRAPGFTAAVVVVLALGIGANAVMFGVVDRLLLSPPQHVADPDEVRHLYVRRAFDGQVRTGRTMTFPDYTDLLRVGAFEAVAAYAHGGAYTVGRGDEATQARVTRASPSLFTLLGARAAEGRFYGSEEDASGAEPTVVLAYEYWERVYGADPAVLGRSLDIAQGTYTIVGVAPAGFTGAELAPVDLWLPIRVSQEIQGHTGFADDRGSYWLRAVARLADGATDESAMAEATAAHRAARSNLIGQDRYDAGAQIVTAPIIAARGPDPSGEASVARWLAGVSLVVLVIACLNVANLLLARAIRNQRDIAVRLALGAGRGRLIVEHLAESLVLAGLGAAAALVLARLLGATVHGTLLPNVAFVDGGLAGRLALFTFAVCLITALMMGLVPAVEASRARVTDALRAGGRGVAAGPSRTRAWLLVGQVALSVVLLVGAGLFVRSLLAAQRIELGFDAREVALVHFEWDEGFYAPDQRGIYEEARDRVARMPGIHAAGLAYAVPFWSSISLGRPRVPGLDSIPRHPSGGPYVNKVGSGYFEAMGLSIRLGRAFVTADDAEGAAPVAIVSESMAEAVWPEGDVLGACMMLDDDSGDAPCTEIVGVVENHRRQDLVEDDPHFLYFLNWSHPALEGPPQALLVGTTGRAVERLGAIRRESRGASPLIRFVDARVLAERVEPELRPWRLGASMFTAFGALALLVAAWGLFSVLAFDVAAREHELGVRSALGAGVTRIVRLVLRRALVLCAAGTAVGLLAASAGAHLIEPLLFRISARDLPIYAAVATALLLVAVLAGALPAWRAARVDPREALRGD